MAKSGQRFSHRTVYRYWTGERTGKPDTAGRIPKTDAGAADDQARTLARSVAPRVAHFLITVETADGSILASYDSDTRVRCNCEASYCDHGESPCGAPVFAWADGTEDQPRMAHAGPVCPPCASTVGAAHPYWVTAPYGTMPAGGEA